MTWPGSMAPQYAVVTDETMERAIQRNVEGEQDRAIVRAFAIGGKAVSQVSRSSGMPECDVRRVITGFWKSLDEEQKAMKGAW